VSQFGDTAKVLWGKASPVLIAGLDATADEIFEKHSFNTRLRIIHLAAQVSHESMGGSHLVESLKYSAKRLTQVWPRRFPTLADAAPYAMNEEALGEKVYGGRLGNIAPEDGFKYRGQGLIQVTGKSNYETLQNRLGLPFVDQPELVCDPKHALEVACFMFIKLGCMPYADTDDIETVTKRINGGYNGLDDRKRWYGEWDSTYPG
jgi:putative chitinase